MARRALLSRIAGQEHAPGGEGGADAPPPEKIFKLPPGEFAVLSPLRNRRLRRHGPRFSCVGVTAGEVDPLDHRRVRATAEERDGTAADGRESAPAPLRDRRAARPTERVNNLAVRHDSIGRWADRDRWVSD